MNIDTSVVGITIPQGAVKNIKRGTEMLWQDGGLPTAFQRCEWIGKTGLNWIDTKIFPAAGHSYELTAAVVSGSNTRFFGNFNSGSETSSICLVCVSATSTVFRVLNGWTGIGAAIKYNEKFTAKYEIQSNKVEAYFNDVLKDAKEGQIVASSKTIGILVNNSVLAGGESGSTVHAYRFTVKDLSGNLVNDFVSCYLKTAWNNIHAGTIGMYDLCGSICPLTNTPFYINAGEGVFTKGADVV